MRQQPGGGETFTRIADVSHYLRRRLSKDVLNGRVDVRDLGLVVTKGDVSVNCTIENRSRNRKAVTLFILAEGQDIRALSELERLEEFFSGLVGGRPERYEFKGGPSEPREATPSRDSTPSRTRRDAGAPPQEPRAEAEGETFGIGYLLNRLDTKFEGPMSILHLTVEENNEVQGFITVRRRGTKRFEIVDDTLERTVPLSRGGGTLVMRFLQNDFNVNPNRCRFRLSTKEEKDAFEQGEQEDIRDEVAAGTLEVASEEDLEAEQLEAPSEDASETVPTMRPKNKRIHPKNRPKKKTRAQARLLTERRDQKDYEQLTGRCIAIAEQMLSNITYDDMVDKMLPLVELASLRGASKNRLRRDLQGNPGFAKLRQLISVFGQSTLGNPTRTPLKYRGQVMPGTARSYSDTSAQQLVALAREMMPREATQNPYQNADSFMAVLNADTRKMDTYQRLLFPEIPGDLFLLGIHQMPEERWGDIGSGRTPEEPESLIRMLPLLNPRIKMVGIDNSYDERTASEGDKRSGRVGTDFPGAELCELRAGYAQDLPLEDESMDRMLSSMVFDKFNDKPEFNGTLQSLREIARVLKPDGEARLVPVRLSELEKWADELGTYFNIENAEPFEYRYGQENERFAFVHLTRKKLSRERFDELKRKSQEWKNTHKQS